MQSSSSIFHSSKKTTEVSRNMITPSAKKPRMSLKNENHNLSQRRKTAKINRAIINICQYKKKQQYNTGRRQQEEVIDQNLITQLAHISEAQKQKQAQMQHIINNRVMIMQQLLQKIRQNKQKLHRKCIENIEIVKNYKFLTDSMAIKYSSLKMQKDSNHQDNKKKIYNIVDEQDKINDFLEKADEDIDKRANQLQVKMNNAFKLSQDLIVLQERHQKLLEKEQLCKKEIEQLMKRKKIQQIHLSTIKIQMNPNLWVGVNIVTNGFDKKAVLDKDFWSWDKKKQRKVTYDDLKRFVLIQMYRGWRSILRKISYQSTQYQILFGEQQNPQTISNLRENMMMEQHRMSQKKQIKSIIFFTQNGNENRRQQLRKLFQNFNNGLINITHVDFVEEESVCYMNLHYFLPGDEKVVQSYIVEQNKNVTKEEIGKYLKMNDRRVFCWIEIPVIFNRQEQSRYEEVYDLVRKKYAWK